MLGKIENLDPIDRMEIIELLRCIKTTLDIIDHLKLEDRESLFSTQRAVIDNAQKSFVALNKFLLG